MKAIKLLIMLALILPSVSAAVTFSLTPSAQNANPGDTVTIELRANNDQAIWGAAVKVDFASPIAYSSNTPGAIIAGSFNGVTQNNPTRITPYAVFAGNTPGIPAGNNKLFDLKFTIPAQTAPGPYQLTLTQPTASDQNGNPAQASISGPATITVQNAPQQPYAETGFYLPSVYGNVGQTIDIPICVSNTEPGRILTSLDITITNNENVVKPTEAEIAQGTGNSDIQPGSAHITINGLNIQNADCEAGSGAYVAYLHYGLQALGVSPLHIQSASAQDQTAQPFSVQALENEDGQITVGTPQVTKHCEPNLGIITQNQAVTITYKISNPGKPATISNNIGGVYNEDIFDDTNFEPTVPPTNLQAGSNLTHGYTGGTGKIEVVQTESPLPFLSGAGTFNIYSIIYDSIAGIPVGTYIFDFNPPPPPALEVSDEFSNDMTASKVSCQVEVIEECTTNGQCDDDNECNGEEACVNGDCVPGTPLGCNDGLACNGQETCSQGGCVPGTSINCNDSNQCTTDACQEPNGNCQNTPISCDDSNQCTTDTCSPTSGCQHTPIPNCEGGGGPGGGGQGGGSGQQTAYICSDCNNTVYPDYEKCCGINEGNAKKFCKNPLAYKQFCVLFGQTVIESPIFTRPVPIAGIEEPEIEQPQAESERKVPPPKQHLAGKAISQATGLQTEGILPWIIGGLVIILLGIFAAVITIRRRPEEPARPIETPEITLEELPEDLKPDVPEIVVKKPEAPKTIYTPVTPKPVKEVPLNKYEAEVRKKLAKAMKAKKRK